MTERLQRWIHDVRAFLGEDMWRREHLESDRPQALAVRFLQLCFVIAEGFVRDQLLLRAHALTYITMLSLIPLVALALSMVGLLGFRERVASELYDRIGEVAPRVATQMRELVDNFDFGSLGAVGGTVLLLTTILAVGNVERSLNHIWGVTKQRGWLRRFPDYLFVILVAPVVLGVALSLGTTLQSPAAVGWLQQIPGFETLYESGLRQLPTLLFVAGFAFLYWFLPNTEVRFLAALLGGLVAGGLFPLALWGYVNFSVGAGRFGAIFGGFAQVPIFLVFVYFSWAIVLLGAEVSYAYQNLGRYRREVRGPLPTPADREAIGLAIALEVAARFEAGGEPWSDDALADHLFQPVRAVRDVVTALEAAGILSERADEERRGRYQLGRPAERVRVADVLEALRGARDVELRDSRYGRAARQALSELDERQVEGPGKDTLADLLARSRGVE